MERNFLGLCSKEPITISEDDNNKDGGGLDNLFMRGSGSGMQWPFSNKVSALSHFMPFKTIADERSKKTVYEPIALSSFMPVSTTDAFDANQKAFGSVVQKSLNLDRQEGGNLYTTTTYPLQPVDVHHPSDIRSFPVSNHTISVSASHPFFKSHLAATGHNFSPTPTKQQQPLGGIPVTTPNLMFPYVSSVAVTSEQRNVSKTAGPPTQLTIFYGGSVNVYDDVSPEKAQAIMFLAGNGASTSQTMTTTPRAQVQGPTPKPVVGADGAQGNQSTSPCSGISSPMSVTSHVSAQSGSGNGCNGTDELMAVKPIRAFAAPICQLEPSKAGPSSRGSVASPLMPAAVPQARKASLARFLEKRKERITNATPYNIGKQSSEGIFKAGSIDFSFSGCTGTGSTPVSKEQTPQSWSLALTRDENNCGNLRTTLEM
ncbi:hypothetical protein GIB67_020947 [Kingdonia uniflora]|uniref:Protein TIFY n=1 Tax=Kingdonia uniflora TaxID=39325 RepID=A0A7J7M7W3_9MAGN|nr:hypothetical protein GIB67_020947 [Kingdonia uniflora]